MFGKKKVAGNTVLILDVESGSVATALVDISKEQPQILAYQRQHLPLTQNRSGGAITKALEQTLGATLRHSAEVASRLRVHAPTQNLGQVSKVVIFLAAPWGIPNLEAGGSQFVSGMRQRIKMSVQNFFGDIPVVFYTSADAVSYGGLRLGKHINTVLVSLRGEMIELLLVNEAGPLGYSTVPIGSHSILRTLQSHGQLSEHEARSMLNLTKHKDDLYYEPLLAAGQHISEQLAEGVELLLAAGKANNLLVLGEQPLGEWFAKSIAGNQRISSLFEEESTVEALLPYHVKGLIGLGTVHDPFIFLEALLVGDKQI